MQSACALRSTSFALRVYNSCAYIHVQYIISFADNLYIAQLNSNPEYKEFVFLILHFMCKIQVVTIWGLSKYEPAQNIRGVRVYILME